jgi:hypothetical protein
MHLRFVVGIATIREAIKATKILAVWLVPNSYDLANVSSGLKLNSLICNGVQDGISQASFAKQSLFLEIR